MKTLCSLRRHQESRYLRLAAEHMITSRLFIRRMTAIVFRRVNNAVCVVAKVAPRKLAIWWAKSMFGWSAAHKAHKLLLLSTLTCEAGCWPQHQKISYLLTVKESNTFPFTPLKQNAQFCLPLLQACDHPSPVTQNCFIKDNAEVHVSGKLGIILWNKIKSNKQSQELSAELSWPWFSFRHYTYASYAHPQLPAPNPHPACERVIKHEAPLLAARLWGQQTLLFV